MFQRDTRVSFLNPAYQIRDDIGMIGIYATENGRYIYVELDKKAGRSINIYAVEFEEGWRCQSADRYAFWYELPIMRDGISPNFLSICSICDPNNIRGVQKNAAFREEFQVTNDQIERFKKVMEGYVCTSVTKEQADKDINNAIGAIGLNTLNIKTSASCTLI